MTKDTGAAESWEGLHQEVVQGLPLSKILLLLTMRDLGLAREEMD